MAPQQRAFYAKRLQQVSLEVVDAAAEIAVPQRLVAPLARLAGANTQLRDLVGAN